MHPTEACHDAPRRGKIAGKSHRRPRSRGGSTTYCEAAALRRDEDEETFWDQDVVSTRREDETATWRMKAILGMRANLLGSIILSASTLAAGVLAAGVFAQGTAAAQT